MLVVLNTSLSLFFVFSVFFNFYVQVLSLHVVRFPTDSLFLSFVNFNFRNCSLSSRNFINIHFYFLPVLKMLSCFMLTSFSSVQFSSVAQLCLTLSGHMNRSTPGLPVHHQLPEFTPTHVHRVGDAIQPSHPLSSPFPSAPNPSQHQSLFQ